MGLIRFLLAFAVLLGHSPTATFKFIHAGTAVQAFFVVSGFYMALVLDGKYNDTKLFYSNRLLRLAPAYFTMMVIAAIALFGFGVTATSTLGIFENVFTNPWSAVVMAFENVFVIGQHLLYWFMLDENGSLVFDPYGGLPSETRSVSWQALLVPQSWSLSIELMFYALAPWLAKRHLRTILGIAAFSIGLRFAGHWLPVEFPLWQGRLFSTALFMFLFGMLAYRAMPLVERLPAIAHWTVGGALALFLVFLPMTGWSGPVQSWLIYVCVAIGTPFAFCATSDNRFDRWIGELSYPIYLTHLVVIAAVLIYEIPLPTWSTILFTLILSAAILQFVERPVDRWRQERARRSGAAEATPETA